MATILELAELAAAAYGTWDKYALRDWELKGGFTSTADDYSGTVFVNEKTKELVITHRGTRPTDVLDIQNDIMGGSGTVTIGQLEAVSLAKSYAADYPDYTIINVGHSLGGQEAATATVALQDAGYRNVSGVTFNAPGIGAWAHDNLDSYNILNISAQGDLINLLSGAHPGAKVILPAGPDPSEYIWNHFDSSAVGGLPKLVIDSGDTLYKILLPAHSINTLISYLASDGKDFGSTVWFSKNIHPASVASSAHLNADGSVDVKAGAITYHYEFDGNKVIANANFALDGTNIDGDSVHLSYGSEMYSYSRTTADGTGRLAMFTDENKGVHYSYFNNDGSYDVVASQNGMATVSEKYALDTSAAKATGENKLQFDVNGNVTWIANGTDGQGYTWTRKVTLTAGDSIDCISTYNGTPEEEITKSDGSTYSSYNGGPMIALGLQNIGSKSLWYTSNSDPTSYEVRCGPLDVAYENNQITSIAFDGIHISKSSDGLAVSGTEAFYAPPGEGHGSILRYNNDGTVMIGDLRENYVFSKGIPVSYSGAVQANFNTYGYLSYMYGSVPDMPGDINQYSNNGLMVSYETYGSDTEHKFITHYANGLYDEQTVNSLTGTLLDEKYVGATTDFYRKNNSDGSSSLKVVDKSGKPIFSSEMRADHLERTAQYDYGSDGGVVETVKDFDGSMAQSIYAAGGTLAQKDLVDAAGNKTTTKYFGSGDGKTGYEEVYIAIDGSKSDTVYNAAGTKTHVTWSDQYGTQGETVFYDDGSRKETQEISNGTKVVTGYNALGKLAEQLISDSDGIVSTDKISYSADGSYVETYDSFGNHRITSFSASGSKIHEIVESTYTTKEYAYNSDGSYSGSITNYDGSHSVVNGSPDGENQVQYDANGIKVMEIANTRTGSLQKMYDKIGALIMEKYDGAEGNYVKDFSASTGLVTHEHHNKNGNVSDVTYDKTGVEISRTWSSANGDYGQKLLLDNNIVADSVQKSDGEKIITVNDSNGLKSTSAVGSYDVDSWSFDFLKSFIAPSSGDDVISVSGGDNVYAYNIGDGRDTILATGVGHDTLSLGGGISLDMISLKKSGSDLIISLWGDSQSVNIQGWYSNASHQFSMLQVILTNPGSAIRVTGESFQYQWFDLEKLVSEYDKENFSSADNPWSATQSLRSAYVAGSDNQAIGGALAKQYGVTHNITVDVIGVAAILEDSGFGISASA